MNSKYKIEDFFNVKSAIMPSFSPNGQEILYLSNTGDTWQVYLSDLENKKEQRQITDYKEPVEFAEFSPVDNRFIFSMANGGNENDQLYIYDLDSKKIEALTDKPDVSYVFCEWFRDGKSILYFSNERDKAEFDIYALDLETKEAKQVFKNCGAFSPISLSQSGNLAVLVRVHSETEVDLYLLDLIKGDAKLINGDTDRTTMYRSPSWLPDDSGFFIVSNGEGDFSDILFYNIKTGKFNVVDIFEKEIWNSSTTDDGKFMAIIFNDQGYSELVVYDTEEWKPISENFLGGKGIATNINWSKDGKLLAVNFSKEIGKTDLFVWSRESNQLRQVTDLPCPIAKEDLVEPELVHYKSFDGLDIPLFLFMPKDAKEPMPVVVDIHGGPAMQYRPKYNALAQYLVNNGFVVAAPNIRGSAGYGKKYMSLDDREKRKDAIQDVAYLHKYLESRSNIDPKKIFLMGGSYGGFMTLAGLAFYPNLWAGGIDIVGISNFISYLENTSAYRRSHREVEYGSLAKDKDFLQSISPINFVEKIKAPLLIIHGKNDPRVPFSEAEQIYNKLRDLGREAELIVYDDEGHGLHKQKNILDAYPKIINFINSNLKKNQNK